MRHAAEFLNPTEAARRLGVSAKALRVYEQRGLIAPLRNAMGWRAYGPAEVARAAEIVALRALGLSLVQVARVLSGDRECLEPALAAHQAMLEGKASQLAATIERVQSIRTDLLAGRSPSISELARLVRPSENVSITFDLPWPWGGERFELRGIRPITYIVGPLGSGKTRLAHALAEALPGSVFIGLDRLPDHGARAQLRIDSEPTLKKRIDRTVASLTENGATSSPALISLLVAMDAQEASALVIDMVEQGLDRATQQALQIYLRRQRPATPPLFLMTRSCCILDVRAVTAEEAIIFCPPNHNPPRLVAAYPGAPGFEAMASCLASPEVRERTAGVVAWRPERV